MYLGQAQYTQGTSGEEVTRIQSMLSAVGYSPGPIDGVFGPQTVSAVKGFQAAKGLMPDGIVGPNTWALLLRLTAPAPAFVPPVPKKLAPVPPGLLGGIDPTWLLLGGVGVVLIATMPTTKKRRTRR